MDNLNKSGNDNRTINKFVAPSAKVLVVDDYQMNLKVVGNLLKRTEITVVEAQSGKECIEMLKKERFDLIFLDHMMPEMDGVETLAVIKEKELCKNTPVIMLTANAIVGNKEKYLEMGFDDFVSKPIIPDKLDDVILKHLPKGLIMYKTDAKTDVADAKSISREVKMSSDELFTLIKEKLPYLDYSVVDNTCGGDISFYMELFHDFTKLTIKSELSQFLEDGDAKNYCIKVHGFKNNAYTIGAKELGDLAFNLEKITKEHINQDVRVLQAKMFEQFDNICEAYISIG